MKAIFGWLPKTWSIVVQLLTQRVMLLAASSAISGWVQEVARETWVSPIMDRIAQDARYAWRGIRQNPGFASVAICTLALGIGSCTGVFTVINAVLLANSSYPNSKRLFVLHQTQPLLGADLLGVSTAEFVDYKTRNRTCLYLSAYEEQDYDVTGGGREPERITGVRASWNLFPALVLRPSSAICSQRPMTSMAHAGSPFSAMASGDSSLAEVVMFLAELFDSTSVPTQLLA